MYPESDKFPSIRQSGQIASLSASRLPQGEAHMVGWPQGLVVMLPPRPRVLSYSSAPTPCPVTLDSWLFLKCTSHAPSTGLYNWEFPLSGSLFPQISACLASFFHAWAIVTL